MRKRGAVWTVLMLLGFLVATAQAAAPSKQVPGAPAPPAALPVQPPAPLPPDLLALEQKMAQLQVTSERFKAELGVKAKRSNRPGGVEKAKRLPALLGSRRTVAARAAETLALFSVTGNVSLAAPQRAEFTVKTFGLKLEGRLIDHTLYSHQPFVTHLDGGRPWVRMPVKDLGAAIGDNSVGPGGTTGPFAKTIATINELQSIQEVGEATVDDQASTEFTGTLDFAKAGGLSPDQIKNFQKLGLTTAQVQIFIAPSGLPVSLRFTFDVKGEGELYVSADTLAINVPVVVHAPPARLTIGEAKLEALERRAAAKQLRKLRQQCRHPRPSQKRVCRELRKHPGKAQ